MQMGNSSKRRSKEENESDDEEINKRKGSNQTGSLTKQYNDRYSFDIDIYNESSNSFIAGEAGRLLSNSTTNLNLMELPKQNKKNRYNLFDGYVFPKDIGEITLVHCGYQNIHICTDKGRVFCLYTSSGKDFEEVHFTGENSVDVVQIVNAENFEFFIMKDGSLWAYRDNTFGNFGIPEPRLTDKPIRIPSSNYMNEIIKKLCCGYRHTLLLTEEGSLFVAGDNSSSQCGFASAPSVNQFTKVENINNKIIDIACGVFHSVFLTSNGELYASGKETNCIGSFDTFTKHPNVTQFVTKIFCGSLSTMYITSDDEFYAASYNHFGEIGVPSTVKYSFGDHQFTKINSLSYIGIKEIKGIYSMLILTEDYQFYVTGRNHNGQLGVYNNNEERVYRLLYMEDIINQRKYTHDISLSAGFTSAAISFRKKAHQSGLFFKRLMTALSEHKLTDITFSQLNNFE
ncbi:hypothetical protein ABK040_004375 [Willaertia magna]